MTTGKLIYITAPNKDEAKQIAKTLLEERLIACANIIDAVNSLYRWQGQIQDESEAILICKTQETKIQKLISEVKKIHSYSCPCILVFSIDEVNQEFLAWVENETK